MTGRFPRLYAIADVDFWGLPRLADSVVVMAEAGIGWIQLRCKSLDERRLFALVEECSRRLAGSSTALWLNDRADLAAIFPVFGIHLGQDDLPPEAARRVLGPGTRIGFSTHSLAQVGVAEANAAVDVVAFGPVFPTSSKKNADPDLGLAALRGARTATHKWLVAIGGIGAEQIAACREAGADAVALISALGEPNGLAARCKALLAHAA